MDADWDIIRAIGYLVMVLLVAAVVGGSLGYQIGISVSQQAAVKANAGYWTVDSATGITKFEFGTK